MRKMNAAPGVVALGVLSVLSVACGAPSDAGREPEIGHVGLALTALTPSGSTYRLNNGSVGIFDNSGHRVATLRPSPDTPVVSAQVKPGAYFAELEAGWVLQRQVDTGWVDVDATVTAQPVGKFNIKPKKVTELRYEFASGFNTGEITDTSSEGSDIPSVPGATGTALVKIAVDDCGLYVGKISSLASFTVACRGKLDNTQYSVSGGVLVRNFSSCNVGTPDDLASIDGVLSLQYDRPELAAEHPKAARDISTNRAYSSACIATEWQEWIASFDPRKINVCPTWQLATVANPPETGVPAVVGAGLPAPECDEETEAASFRGFSIFHSSPPPPPPPEEPECDVETDPSHVAGADPDLVTMQKTELVYTVSFPAGSPAAKCGTPAQCAQACAAGYKGFVVSTNGVDQVTVDPPYWESDKKYGSASNPYLEQGYYHAMADYGPVPGDQFGHWQRAQAVLDRSGKWVGERCSYYLGNVRYYTRLIYTSGRTGAVSWCTPDP